VTPLERHVRQRQVELAQSIAGRKKVYLDLRFWIIARKVIAGESIDSADCELLHLLRRGVSAGKLICPISDSTFMEVMKQVHTPTRRIATAALIDELSLGVSLLTGRSRMATEVAVFLYRQSGRTDLYEIEELIWTKLAYALGDIHPTASEFGPELQFEVQRRFFDEMWEHSLSQIVARMGDQRWDAADMRQSAERINIDIKTHAGTLVSYERTYRDELAGVIDLCGDFAADVFCTMAEREGIASPRPGGEAWINSATASKHILLAAVQMPEHRKALRSVHCQASLHAALRWNKGTNFTANHHFDFEHATAALGYCDAFFTEGQLANLINAGNTRLPELNGCRTTNDVDEAVEILRALSAQA
jgi:hypothetical protein